MIFAAFLEFCFCRYILGIPAVILAITVVFPGIPVIIPGIVTVISTIPAVISHNFAVTSAIRTVILTNSRLMPQLPRLLLQS